MPENRNETEHSVNVLDSQLSAYELSIRNPRYPAYSDAAKRMESFSTWPESSHLKPADIVQAGCFYTGYGDAVRCFHCAGGLRNFDPGDRIWEEHAKWYPICPYTKRVKGQAYIEAVQRGERPDEVGQ